MPGWNASKIPDQSGRTAVVTGANSGIGYVTARELARHGASVVLACRSAARGQAALVRLRAEVPGAEAEFIPLDLADLASVREFAGACGQRRASLDLLVNNAGVMALPYGRTADGFETQFGVNHLGHFALTGLLLPRLRAAAPGARIVNVSSGFHVLGRIDVEGGGMDALSAEHGYRRWVAYGRSKTANLLFTHELSRRFTAAGSTITAAAAHPGYASSNLHSGASKVEGPTLNSRVAAFGNAVVAQPTSSGALPTLYAATAPGVGQDAFIGPRFGWRGAPAPSWRAKWTLDDTSGELFWAASEKLTGVSYASLPR
ncbi:oxidoreductase [Streptomyces sp. NPDC048357]|uniref:oxidoreductase n=1 Tax=Streptomyces sp. NPDC048357 TaxID=3154719 RepID=UPI00341A03A4